MKSIAVVGAGVAGWRTAESLRRAGFGGALTVLGAEADLPYQRPALSKQYLAGRWRREQTALRMSKPLSADVLLGHRVTDVDFDRRTLSTNRGGRVRFDGLVIATGSRARGLPWMTSLEGIHTLRDLHDCDLLRIELDTARRVAVVGAGFIGTEVAATCRTLGKDVVLIDAATLPMSEAVGDDLAGRLLDEHRSRGVDVKMGVGVASAHGDHHVRELTLSDGSVVEVDLVVVGVGVVPNTELFEHTGILVEDGVVCDATCAAVDMRDVVAVGDVARWFHTGYGRTLRLEHWDNAIRQAEFAATRLLRGADAGEYTPVPFFWSDQYSLRLQVLGMPRYSDEALLLDGDLNGSRFVVEYRDRGRVTGAALANSPTSLAAMRTEVQRGLAESGSLLN